MLRQPFPGPATELVDAAQAAAQHDDIRVQDVDHLPQRSRQARGVALQAGPSRHVADAHGGHDGRHRQLLSGGTRMVGRQPRPR